MYFSRIVVHPHAQESERYWKAFRSSYSVHQAIWELFGDHPDRNRDFLYHVKNGARSPVVYALSARAPKNGNDLWHVEVPKEFAPKLREGMQLGFLLRANPVVTRKPATPDPNPKKRKRHDMVMEEKHRLRTDGVPKEKWPREAELVQTAGERWLHQRSERSGFRVGAVRADGYRQHRFRKGGSREVRLSTVDFSGVLQVSDPTKFLDTLRQGLGPAKSFGCGLMLIRRV